MIEINYTPSFMKAYDKLDKSLKSEVLEKIEMLKDRDKHKSIKVHKLHGKIKDKHSLYVNYKYRIIFKYLPNKEIALMDVGDHDI